MERKGYGKRKRSSKSLVRKPKKAKLSVYPRFVEKGFPARCLFTKLKYATQFAASTTVMDANLINLNGLFDPEGSIAGHQPQGFDQLVLLYNRYRVDWCDVEITAMGHSVSGTQAKAGLVICATNSTTLFTEAVSATEQRSGERFLLNQGSVLKIKRRYWNHAVTGVTRSVYKADDRYQALVNANPTEVIQLHILITDGGNGLPAATTDMIGDLTLTYGCEFFDPVQLGLS